MADRRRTVVELLPVAEERMAPVVTNWAEDLMELVGSRTPEEWAIITKFMREFQELTNHHTGRLTALGDAEIQALAQIEP